MKKIILSVIAICFLSSCVVYERPAVSYQKLSKNLNIGMTKQQVFSVLGKPYAKKIRDKKETYIFYCVSKTSNKVKVANTILFPFVILGIPLVRSVNESSQLNVQFDENGNLEHF